jgi:hypothetical protein
MGLVRPAYPAAANRILLSGKIRTSHRLTPANQQYFSLTTKSAPTINMPCAMHACDVCCMRS